MKICRLIVLLIYLLLTSAPNLQQSNGFQNMEYLSDSLKILN
jgi:hypothetical protein